MEFGMKSSLNKVFSSKETKLKNLDLAFQLSMIENFQDRANPVRKRQFCERAPIMIHNEYNSKGLRPTNPTIAMATLNIRD
jgi:hypothetical protein